MGLVATLDQGAATDGKVVVLRAGYLHQHDHAPHLGQDPVLNDAPHVVGDSLVQPPLVEWVSRNQFRALWRGAPQLHGGADIGWADVLVHKSPPPLCFINPVR